MLEATMNITRRRFVEGIASSLFATGILKSRVLMGEQESTPRLPIVDTHQHLWDLGKLRLPWIKPNTPLHRNYLTEDYLRASAGLDVVKAVYMEVAVASEDQLAEAEYVIGLCRQTDNPTVAAVIGGEPGSEGFRSYIMRFKESPYIKGIRRIPPAAQGDTFLYRQESFVDDIRLLGELGMSFDLCAPPQRLADTIMLVDDCPGMQFILDHCGNADPKAFWNEARRAENASSGRPSHHPDPWRRGMAELAKREQVVCKISGIVARAPKDTWTADDLAPIVNHCLELFGPDRVMFASDWPVCTRAATFRQWVHALNEIVQDRSEAERRKLFSENAIRVYGLES
ncbi:MAG: amidohydrolase [Pirellulaceae bacterium]